jgi:hypothetical protein
MSLNVALASLHLRLPHQDTPSEAPGISSSSLEQEVVVPPIPAGPDGAAAPAELTTAENIDVPPTSKTTDTVSGPFRNDMLTRVTQNDLEYLDKVLGDDSIAVSRPQFAPQYSGHSSRDRQWSRHGNRAIHFHTMSDVDATRWQSRSGPAVSMAARRCDDAFSVFALRETPSAPKPQDDVFSIMHETRTSWKNERDRHSSSELMPDSYVGREKFLMDMKRCRANFDFYN